MGKQASLHSALILRNQRKWFCGVPTPNKQEERGEVTQVIQNPHKKEKRKEGTRAVEYKRLVSPTPLQSRESSGETGY